MSTKKQENDSKYQQAVRDMLALSYRIMKATGMTQKDMDRACKGRSTFFLGEFVVRLDNLCLPAGWMVLFVAIPKVALTDGAFPSENAIFPNGWSFYPRGTATVIAPSDPAIADKIVEAVKSY